MGFATIDDVKISLGIALSDTSQDARIQAYVNAANAELLTLFGLDTVNPTVYTNKYDIITTPEPGFWLIQYPVIDIQSVTVDGDVIDSDEYYLARPQKFGCINRKNGYWDVSNQYIEVSHTAGFAVVPPQLTRAAVLLAIYMYNTEPKEGFEREKIGQYMYRLAGSVSIEGYGGAAAGGWPAGVSRILSQWIRPFASVS